MSAFRFACVGGLLCLAFAQDLLPSALMAYLIPNELSEFIVAKSNLPTPSAEDCYYWPEERQWVPERLFKKLKPADRKQLKGAKAIVQKAVSGQLRNFTTSGCWPVLPSLL